MLRNLRLVLLTMAENIKKTVQTKYFRLPVFLLVAVEHAAVIEIGVSAVSVLTWLMVFAKNCVTLGIFSTHALTSFNFFLFCAPLRDAMM